MTHSLHRRGSRQSLAGDYVWQPYPAQGINDDDLPEKYLKIIEIVEKIGAPNWGDVKTGARIDVGLEKILANLSNRSRIRGVFTSKTDVIKFLREMKAADIGLSLVISGLIDEVLEACSSAGLKPHSINLSLGIWGRKELLPREEILEITTMCGHHMIAQGIVESVMEKVNKRQMSSSEASKELAKLCPCGIFNQVRAEELIKKSSHEHG